MTRALPARHRLALVAAALAAATGLVSCSTPAPPPVARPYMPPSPPSVVVTMSEFRFVFARRIPTGRVVFKVVNGGRLPHRLTLVELADDAPPVAELVNATGGVDLQPVAQMRELAPNGDYDSFAFQLEPGQRYGMFSLVSTPEGKVDAALGMHAEFRTPGRPPPLPTDPAPS